jgi:hypothetical protein
MEKQNYNCVYSGNISPAAAADEINSVAIWWSEDFTGASEKAGDVFTVRFGKEIYKTFKITELVPEKKIVWQVIDCYMPWLNDKHEWTGTSVVWEISGKNGSTQVSMTHVGLVPEVECYNDCEKGWNYYLKESLFKLLNGQAAKPEKIKIAQL